jgi:hypothetical protein
MLTIYVTQEDYVLWFFIFGGFFEFFMRTWILVKSKLARFDQALNKFKTWKWKSKHVSFLVTPKLSFSEVFEISIL